MSVHSLLDKRDYQYASLVNSVFRNVSNHRLHPNNLHQREQHPKTTPLSTSNERYVSNAAQISFVINLCPGSRGARGRWRDRRRAGTWAGGPVALSPERLRGGLAEHAAAAWGHRTPQPLHLLKRSDGQVPGAISALRKLRKRGVRSDCCVEIENQPMPIDIGKRWRCRYGLGSWLLT